MVKFYPLKLTLYTLRSYDLYLSNVYAKCQSNNCVSLKDMKPTAFHEI